MYNMLTVNILMTIALVTNLTGLSSIVDVNAAVKTEVPRVQGTEAQSKEQLAEQRRLDIEAKRLEIEQKVAEKRAAATEKLSGKRAEECLAKQEQINRMLRERSETAKRHFDTFKAVHERLETYVANKQLDIEHAGARQIIMNEAHDDALIAIETISSAQFDCATTNAAAPGAIIKEQVATAKQALVEYRTAIKDYSIEVKAAATTAESTQKEPVSKPESTGESNE